MAEKKVVAKKPAAKPAAKTPKSKPTVKKPALKKPAAHYFSATGRRKSAIASVRFQPEGKGKVTVNGLTIDQYFNTWENKIIAAEALKLTGTETADVSVIVRGGGKTGQAEAMRHGLARALTLYNKELRPALRAKGFMTRDPRVKERKKPGLKKARRAPQWSKR